jgi:hypothetical protein
MGIAEIVGPSCMEDSAVTSTLPGASVAREGNGGRAAKDISNEQAIKVAVKYLHDNPAKLNLLANYLIRLSMEDAFPCKSP